MFASKFIRKIFGVNPEGIYVIEFEPFCTLEYKRVDSESFGIAKDLNPANWIEISIESDDPERSIDTELRNMREFIVETDAIMDKIYSFMAAKFVGSKRPKSSIELRNIYYLSSISLRNDGSGIWVVLFPNSEVETSFNFLPRFTIFNGEITWSNLV